MSPVALRVQIAQLHMILQSERDPRRRIGDLPRDEFQSPALRFVIEQNAAAGEQPEALTVILCDPVAVQLCNTVGAARIKRRLLVLRDGLHLAEHLRGRCLIEFRLRPDRPDRFEHIRDTERIDLRCRDRLLPARCNKALRREIVHLVRL